MVQSGITESRTIFDDTKTGIETISLSLDSEISIDKCPVLQDRDPDLDQS